jgi:serine/threonine protein kinase
MLNIVMEYAEGGDLSQRLKASKDRFMNEDLIWHYVIQMAQVLYSLEIDCEIAFVCVVFILI